MVAFRAGAKCQTLLASVCRCRFQGRIGYLQTVNSLPLIRSFTTADKLHSRTPHIPSCSPVGRRFSSSKDVTKRQEDSLLVTEMSSTTRTQFIDFYPELIKCLKGSSTLQELPGMQEWVEKVVEYNVQGGKLNRGLALVESFSILSENASDEETKVAMALGWAIELLQAFFLVADDIMDGSHTRRTKPCWYRTNNLGVKAFNDSILLESACFQIISSYCRGRPYYTAVLELFHDVTMRTSLGQAMDLQSAPNPGERPDLDKFTQATYDAIVKYKTAYYSFYLPVAIAMRMAGLVEEDLFQRAEEILLQMGHFFQVQDDYLDCFGDENVTGKIGTDIEDGKCTWLAVRALSSCQPDQLRIFEEHYGRQDPESVARIKTLYGQLGISKLYADYEEESYNRLSRAIREVGTTTQLPAIVFQGFMDKIYKRSH